MFPGAANQPQYKWYSKALEYKIPQRSKLTGTIRLGRWDAALMKTRGGAAGIRAGGHELLSPPLLYSTFRLLTYA